MPIKPTAATQAAEKLHATPSSERGEAWIDAAWTTADKLRKSGHVKLAERLEDACERQEAASDGRPVKRATRSDAKATSASIIGRVVANAIRDGYGLGWALRYAGIDIDRHDRMIASSPDYQREMEGLDPDALPIDARPKPLPVCVPFAGERPATTDAAPAR